MVSSLEVNVEIWFLFSIKLYAKSTTESFLMDEKQSKIWTAFYSFQELKVKKIFTALTFYFGEISSTSFRRS